MSNIHTLGEYRAAGNTGRQGAGRPGPTAARPGPTAAPASKPRSSNFGTLSDFRESSSSHEQGGFAEVGYSYEPSRVGLSFFRADDLQPGVQPSCRQRCCPRMGWRYLTTVIALIDTVILIIELIVGSVMYGCAFASGNEMGGPNSACLFCFGGKFQYDIRQGAVWRLFTPIFLHAGILHLFANMFMLLRAGYSLEARWGWWRYGLVYLLTGITASLWSSVIDYSSVSVGASGAIMGLLGADITYLLYNWHEIPDIKMEAMFLGIVILITFLLGLAGTGIDNAAHIGGLVAGLPLGICLVPHVEKRTHEKLFRIAGAIVFAGLFLLFCLLLFVGNPGGSYQNFGCGQKNFYNHVC